MHTLQPQSVKRAFDNLLNKMYINNVANRLRELNEPKESDKKRWIWELIQNAKDSIAHDAEKDSVEIEMIIDENRFIFKHNGSPFTADAQLGLLYKYSEGKRSDSESTGRFGTGFMTTHTLSKHVDIESNLVDDDGKVYGFKATMFREGYLDEELLSGIERTSQSISYYEPNSEWTSLTYYLKNENNFSALSLGLESFEQNIVPTLAFCKEVKSIKLNNNGTISSFERLAPKDEGEFSIQNFSISKGSSLQIVSVVTLGIDEPNEELSTRFKKERNLRLSVAVCIDQKELLFDEKTPSLFCILPLIGSEKFRFPCLINSPDFEPHNEREKLYLNGKEFDEENGVVSEVGINKMIFRRSTKLYEEVLRYFTTPSDEKPWTNLHLLAVGVGKPPVQDEYFDSNWYEENVSTQLRNSLLTCPVVETDDGPKPIKAGDQEIRFPRRSTGTNEVREKVWQFTNQLFPGMVPKLSLVESWDKLVWDDCKSQTVKSLCEQVSAYKTLAALPVSQNKIQWLDSFLSLVQATDKTLLEEYPLIPNQNLDFCLLNLEGFSEDDGLPEQSHEILSLFKVEWKSTLRLPGINVSLQSKKSPKDLSDLVNKELKQLIKEDNDQVLTIVLQIAALLPHNDEEINDDFIAKRRNLWKYSKSIHKVLQADLSECQRFPLSLWKEADEWLFSNLIQTISSNNEINEIDVELADGQTNISWLNEFIGFLISQNLLEKLNEEGHFIIPNQNEKFCAKKSLLKDDNIPEELKTKQFDTLGLRSKDKLLHKEINTFQPEGSPYTITMFVAELNELLAKQDSEGKEDVIIELISLFPKADSLLHEKREAIWHFSRNLFGNTISVTKTELANYSEDLWRISDAKAIESLLTKLGSLQPKLDEANEPLTSLAQLSTMIFPDSQTKDEIDAALWLNGFLKFLLKYHVSLEGLCIVPNQNDNFVEFKDLCQDEIHDHLKNIINLLDPKQDIRNDLIHSAISLQPIEVIDFAKLGGRIRELIKNGFDRSKTEYEADYRDAVKSLVVEWFNQPKYPHQLYQASNNRDSINKEYFGWAFEHRYELENLVLSTVEERKIMYQREKEIKEGTKVVIDAAEYELLKKNQRISDAVAETLQNENSVEGNSDGKKPEKLSDEETNHLKEIELLLGNRVTKQDMVDSNYQAKLLSLDYLKRQGFNIENAEDKLEDDFSFVDGISKEGRTLKVIVKSAQKGTLYINPTEWLNLSADNCFMLVFFSKDHIRKYDSPSAILSENPSTLCRLEHATIGEDQIQRLADQNQYVNTFKFIFFTEANSFMSSDALKAVNQETFAPGANELSEDFLDD